MRRCINSVVDLCGCNVVSSVRGLRGLLCTTFEGVGTFASGVKPATLTPNHPKPYTPESFPTLLPILPPSERMESRPFKSLEGGSLNHKPLPAGPKPSTPNPKTDVATAIGALIIRIGFWGPLYYNYNKEPPKWYW